MAARLGDQVVSLLQDFVAALPAGTANLEIHHPKNNVVWVRMNPANPRAAPLDVTIEEGCPNFYVWAGERIPLEMMCNSLEELRDICNAVAEGKVRENLWYVGNEVVKSIGEIELGGGSRTMRYYGSWFPFRRKETKQIKYEPYASAGRST